MAAKDIEISQGRRLFNFLSRDNVVPIVTSVLIVGIAYGAINTRQDTDSRRIDKLEQWREDDHNTLKDVQGDQKAMLDKMNEMQADQKAIRHALEKK